MARLLRRRGRVPAHAAGTRPAATTPIKNDATGAQQEDEAPYDGLRLPHERDENTDPPTDKPRPDIERAERDIEEGQVDTDCYGKTRVYFQRRERHRRG